MEANDYWSLHHTPLFTSIDWSNGGQESYLDYDPKSAASYQQPLPPPPFQRRRSSSVDLPINPLFLNKVINEPTIIEEDFPFKTDKVNLTFPTEFSYDQHRPSNSNTEGTATTTSTNAHLPDSSSSPISTSSSIESHNLSPTMLNAQQQQQQQQQTITFFPELQKTTYNTELGKKLRQHTKRRRSSSLPPAFQGRNQYNKPQNPVIFASVQVTDPRPIQHTSKALKVEAPPMAIERVPKKPQPKPVVLDPAETKRRLDEQLLHVNFDDVTVAELKEMLRERGLLATGKKAVLIERLKEARDRLIKSGANGKQPSPQAQPPKIQVTQQPDLPNKPQTLLPRQQPQPQPTQQQQQQQQQPMQQSIQQQPIQQPTQQPIQQPIQQPMQQHIQQPMQQPMQQHIQQHIQPQQQSKSPQVILSANNGAWALQQTESPALQSLANMTIHSPIPAQDSLLSSSAQSDTIFTSSPNSMSFNDQDIDINGE
ncbi:hypothetical protein G6F70_004101 [Rhizopus microsporus]|uniref:SAP domain-containing protein n=2 Tax=Rhizopus TaxID=4842 RepID=A0A367K1I7_RHIAZ|nr:hypothetical protein G6F71_000164 [Rhizopus microsporus]RCH96074.1 hypothetical protein CU097_003012 [Rhizopus azygosporus]KAG1200383.1 hypothetical protein G6F70_004101 [Rhizopus microsporus]KAG1216200.1 hypothetical protein G6F69_000254 [Rhizopus microsporus]KAG1233957.1 hypothetical protein G6F67_003884 [Rhizopus microsporus]